jgi:hypothetical protein
MSKTGFLAEEYRVVKMEDNTYSILRVFYDSPDEYISWEYIELGEFENEKEIEEVLDEISQAFEKPMLKMVNGKVYEKFNIPSHFQRFKRFLNKLKFWW